MNHAPQTPRLIALAAAARFLRSQANCRVIGVVSKPSRSRDLAERRLLSAFPPRENRQTGQQIAFLPIDWPHEEKNSNGPLSPSGAGTHAAAQEPFEDSSFIHKLRTTITDNLSGVLVKATDFLRVSSENAPRIDPRIDVPLAPSLLRFLDTGKGRNWKVVEEPGGLAPVMDRPSMMQVLEQAAASSPDVHWRPPHCAYSDSCTVSALQAAATKGKLQYPFLVKARIGCGPPESHHMALILSPEGLGLVEGHVPPPVVLQEFQEHGGQQLKVYVIQDRVFWSDKKSLPDLSPILPSAPSSSGSEPTEAYGWGTGVTFSSLVDMPTDAGTLLSRLSVQREGKEAASREVETGGPVDVSKASVSVSRTEHVVGAPEGLSKAPKVTALIAEERVRSCAAAIRACSGLSIFGFDIVVPRRPEQGGGAERGSDLGESSKEFLVVDLNAFPSFKGFDPDEAAQAIAECF